MFSLAEASGLDRELGSPRARPIGTWQIYRLSAMASVSGQSNDARRRKARRRDVTGAVIAVALISSCSSATDNGDAGFGSPEKAAEAFDASDLQAVEPWDPRDGRCRALLVGDSLVEAVAKSHEQAFTYLGCESIVDGLSARSLSDGWQCLGSGGTSMEIVLRQEPEPGNPTCRPSGLELLDTWSELAPAASVTVIALGTNDAGMFGEETWVRRWMSAVDATSGPLVFVTAAARPGDRWVEKVGRYNEVLRSWCPTQTRCTLAEWDRTAPARDAASYIDHVHLTRSAGEMRAIFIAAAALRVAVPSLGGPSRWKAPALELPPAPSSTTVVSNVIPSSTVWTSTSAPAGSTTTSTALTTPSGPGNGEPGDPSAVTTTSLP